MTANWINQSIWTGDNLDIMRGMNSDSVDMIYLDPPFNSKADYAAPIGSEAAGSHFKDTWGLQDINLAWHGLIKADYPNLYNLLHTVRGLHGASMMSYLIYMAIRLIEMKRLLKSTGSIFLHCDDHADSYLRLTMDAIFGKDNFRNEITWRRSTSHNDAGKFGRNTDTIWFYAKNHRKMKWNGSFTKKTEEQLKSSYPSCDNRGKYRPDNLTGPGTTAGESGQPWKGCDPNSLGRCWSAPLTGRYAEWIEENLIPGYRSIKGVHARLDALYEADLIILPKGQAKWPSLKRYAVADAGHPAQALIYEPTGFTNFSNSKEFVKYPTQKPVKIVRLFIEATTDPGDMVLDPFCGCATACIAAEYMEKRQWIGIDVSQKAAELVKSRMHNELGFLFEGAHRTDIPKRTDLGNVPPYNDKGNKGKLLEEQGGFCNGCEVEFTIRHFEIDHIIPRSKGGTDHISNLQLLCSNCNRVKGNMSQEELMVRLTDKGYIKKKKKKIELI